MFALLFNLTCMLPVAAHRSKHKNDFPKDLLVLWNEYDMINALVCGRISFSEFLFLWNSCFIRQSNLCTTLEREITEKSTIRGRWLLRAIATYKFIFQE